jgi:L-fuculose-phosphate aldolase
VRKSRLLAERSQDARRDENGSLLASHGMIALGTDLGKVMRLAVALETIARQYYLSLAPINPLILTDEQIAETAHGFRPMVFTTSLKKDLDRPCQSNGGSLKGKIGCLIPSLV